MRSSKTIHVISAQAEGEVGDVIAAGYSPHLAQRCGSSRGGSQKPDPSQFSIGRTSRRCFSPFEPAGSAERPICRRRLHYHGAGGHTAEVQLELVVSGDRAAGWRYHPDAGAGARMLLEAPGGIAHVRAECKHGKAERIFVRHLDSAECVGGMS